VRARALVDLLVLNMHGLGMPACARLCQASGCEVFSESHSIRVPTCGPALRTFWRDLDVRWALADGGRQGRSHDAHEEEYDIKQ
jgi:hypothetical protein